MNDQVIPPAVLKVAEALIASGIEIPPLTPSPQLRKEPYRVAEIASALGVHRATIYRDIEAGRCEAYRIGEGSGALRVEPADFEKYKQFIKGRAATRPTSGCTGSAVAS